MAMDYELYPEITACFTGHRAIARELLPVLRFRLEAELRRAYSTGYRFFLCGGALGFDTLAAQAVLSLRAELPDLRLIMILPCGDQDRFWSAREQRIYQQILTEADHCRVLADRYSAGCMQSRNRFLVDHATLCICYFLHPRGGTFQTVRYAFSEDLTIVNLAFLPESGGAVLKEDAWNYTSTSPSADKNADTATLRLLRDGKSKSAPMRRRF